MATAADGQDAGTQTIDPQDADAHGAGAPSEPDREPRARRYGREERFADLLVHALALTTACIGAVLLLLTPPARPVTRVIPLAVYAATLIATFLASAAYNLAYDTRYRSVLRRIDHSTIFLLIAGTYTPFTTQFASRPLAIGGTAAVWALALGGIAVKLTRPRWFERVSVILYMAFGWSALALLPTLIASVGALPPSLLLAGGALFSAGVPFHLREQIPFHNAIWHGFVLAAAACQYSSVFVAAILRHG